MTEHPHIDPRGLGHLRVVDEHYVIESTMPARDATPTKPLIQEANRRLLAAKREYRWFFVLNILIAMVVIWLLSGCNVDLSDELLPECRARHMPGQWEAIGQLRDRVNETYDEDPRGGITFRWCPGDRVPTTEFRGWCIGCGEKLLAERWGLGIAIHEAGHCFRERVLHDPDAGHADREWWALVGD